MVSSRAGRWMRWRGTFLWIVCALGAATAATAISTQSIDVRREIEVVGLTLNTVDRVFTKGERWLVEIYSMSCIHCRKFAPSYDAVRQQLSTKPAVWVAKVNAAESVILLNRFKVRHFPFFVLVDEQNNVYTFEGLHSVHSLVDFAREKVDAALIQDVWFGPTSSFWLLATKLALLSKRTIGWINEKDVSGGALGLAVVTLVLAMIAFFALVLNLTTRPPAPTKRD
eukprot:CAMPEP_0198734242 /NCGR_PEP_ID=MMETSP1475-20131203/51278_1 /TAXON_ID= ORGANISM="Unidentified sp., Strain CCMP1999" /NCGR_SAMPLE_ID=MMETSP1475 /ASSEMBLY_ACC=CAM_ASM_001111 /LENGTH=225 /DNA_ID=CAMNT_0044497673 /DNA_START=98 /DNA_END=775 /DNA_ORIENTATION=-